MRALIIGAGAVGQVYGHHLQRGGAELSFFVKQKYVEQAQAGYTLYPLHRPERGEPVAFDGYDVLSTLDEVRARDWDQVWVTVSGDALMAGDWLEQLVRAAGDPVVVVLTPGVQTRAFVLGFVEPNHLVTGLIALISYQAPLSGETRFAKPGVAYWFPPLGKSPFEGAPAQDCVDALLRGGQPAVVNQELASSAGMPGALNNPYLMALESCRWSFDRLVQSPRFGLAWEGAREAMAIVSRHHGESIPWAMRLANPTVMRMVLWLAPKLLPLPFEVYIAYHFGKVSAQTHSFMRGYVELGKAQGMPVGKLEALLRS